MIDFMTEGVEMPAVDFAKIKKWINALGKAHDRHVGNINYLFCSDEYILEQNRKFLEHDYFTDIITFDYSHGNRISGDIMISLDTVKSNATLVGDSYERELHRVIAHGVLHLCGIDDKGPGQREIMESEEDKALDLYKILEP